MKVTEWWDWVMSVVAGCLLFDGVLIAADTRISYPQPNGPDVRVDNGLKVFPFAPGTAIGYVGHVDLASALFQRLIAERNRRSRLDPFSLSLWLPRILRYTYDHLKPSLRSLTTNFLVASSFEHRLNVVERNRVGTILWDAVMGGCRGSSSTIALQILSLPAGHTHVALSGTHQSVLYRMGTPNFKPESCAPLSFTAIGSGKGAVQQISTMHHEILFGSPGHSGTEALWFRDAISSFVEHNHIYSVGGLYPAIKVRGNAFEPLGQGTLTHKRGSSAVEADVKLRFEQGRWIQQDMITGDTLPLRLPWELNRAATVDRLFDYVDSRRWNTPTS